MFEQWHRMCPLRSSFRTVSGLKKPPSESKFVLRPPQYVMFRRGIHSSFWKNRYIWVYERASWTRLEPLKCVQKKYDKVAIGPCKSGPSQQYVYCQGAQLVFHLWSSPKSQHIFSKCQMEHLFHDVQVTKLEQICQWWICLYWLPQDQNITIPKPLNHRNCDYARWRLQSWTHQWLNLTIETESHCLPASSAQWTPAG